MSRDLDGREELIMKKVAVLNPAFRSPILVDVGMAMVATTKTQFVARNRFVLDTKASAVVKISYLEPDFSKWFLSKREMPFVGSTLHYKELSFYSIDGPIIEELGGKEMVETTLAEIFSLIEKQPNGEPGSLLTNGNANIFYVKDVDGVLRVVLVSWHRGGWSFHANPVMDRYGWGCKSRVFARKLP